MMAAVRWGRFALEANTEIAEEELRRCEAKYTGHWANKLAQYAHDLKLLQLIEDGVINFSDEVYEVIA
jgi:hypothetical protein